MLGENWGEDEPQLSSDYIIELDVPVYFYNLPRPKHEDMKQVVKFTHCYTVVYCKVLK